jgi:hypothetical protein
MRLRACLFLTVLVTAAVAAAQVEIISDNFFPADLEFQELREIASDESFEDPGRLAAIDDGPLFSDVGFEKYAHRVYSTRTSGSLSIEVVTLKDNRAAFSLLTMLRTSSFQDGPPGDAFVAWPNLIHFAKGRQWVRIRGRGVSGDRMKQVALSVSNRIGSQRKNPPSLISHFPKPGYDASSLRYFVGPQSFKSYSITAPGGFAKFTPDTELAQARYNLQNQTGVLFLSIFPTAQVVEGYFSELGDLQSAPENSLRTYAKRTGPLIAILEGSFDPGVAGKILNPIEYSFSIRWIYEKPKPKTIWGVPSAILGTVVNSLLFVALLCGVSILAGVGYAVFRVWLRGAAPRNPLDRPERTEITHLRLR